MDYSSAGKSPSIMQTQTRPAVCYQGVTCKEAQKLSISGMSLRIFMQAYALMESVPGGAMLLGDNSKSGSNPVLFFLRRIQALSRHLIGCRLWMLKALGL